MPTLQTKTLFPSAGHSHSDPDAAANGKTEEDIVLAFRDKSKQAPPRKYYDMV